MQVPGECMGNHCRARRPRPPTPARRRRPVFTAAARAARACSQGVRLIDHFSREVVDDIFACALKKQTGVSLKYM